MRYRQVLALACLATLPSVEAYAWPATLIQNFRVQDMRHETYLGQSNGWAILVERTRPVQPSDASNERCVVPFFSDLVTVPDYAVNIQGHVGLRSIPLQSRDAAPSKSTIGDFFLSQNERVGLFSFFVRQEIVSKPPSPPYFRVSKIRFIDNIASLAIVCGGANAGAPVHVVSGGFADILEDQQNGNHGAGLIIFDIGNKFQINSNPWSVTSNQRISCNLCSGFGGEHRSLHIASLAPSKPNESASHNNKSDCCNSQKPSQYNDPPIGRRLVLALLGVLCGLGLSIFGWNSLYNKRRFLGASYLTGAIVCASSGFGLLLATLCRASRSYSPRYVTPAFCG